MRKEDSSERGGGGEGQKQGFFSQKVNLLIAISILFPRQSFLPVLFWDANRNSHTSTVNITKSILCSTWVMGKMTAIYTRYSDRGSLTLMDRFNTEYKLSSLSLSCLLHDWNKVSGCFDGGHSDQLKGSCCITQGAEPSALWWPRGAGGGGGVGGRLKREGTYVYLGLIPVVVWQKPTQYCKAIIFQLKIKCRKRAGNRIAFHAGLRWHLLSG